MAGHERTVPELIKTAKALQAKAEHAAGKAEQFYISLGLTLQELKQRKPKDITWPAFVAKHFTLGRRRADELIQIASGTTTVDASRERARVGMKRSRQNGRNVTPDRPVKPATEKEMQEHHQRETANECKLWLVEHPGRTSADYTKLLSDPNMLDNELGDWRRAKARAFDDAMRRDWLIEHPGEEPLPEHECAFDAEASRWIDDYRSKRRQVSAVANVTDNSITVERWTDGTFLIHDGKRIAKQRSDFVRRKVDGVVQVFMREPDDQWKPLVPGVRITTGGTGCARHNITVTFDADERGEAAGLHAIPSPSVQTDDDTREDLSEMEQAWLVFLEAAKRSTREDRKAFYSHAGRRAEIRRVADPTLFGPLYFDQPVITEVAPMAKQAAR